MEMKTRCMNANTDKELFVEAHHNAFTLPEIFDFHPHYGDRVSNNNNNLAFYLLIIFWPFQ